MRWLDRTALAELGRVLVYAVFEWGGVVRTDQYLMVLGLLALALSLGRARDERPPLACALGEGEQRWKSGLKQES
jgi:hypothetical protein